MKIQKKKKKLCMLVKEIFALKDNIVILPCCKK